MGTPPEGWRTVAARSISPPSRGPKTPRLWLRWTEVNDPGSDHGLAIDDPAIAIPNSPPCRRWRSKRSWLRPANPEARPAVRISRTGRTIDDLTVPISLRSGAGLATNDDLTTPLPASVVIPAGSTSVDLAIEVRDDDLDEGSEILAIEITAPSGYALAASGALAEITILDNDRISLISAVQGSGSASPWWARASPCERWWWATSSSAVNWAVSSCRRKPATGTPVISAPKASMWPTLNRQQRRCGAGRPGAGERPGERELPARPSSAPCSPSRWRPREGWRIPARLRFQTCWPSAAQRSTWSPMRACGCASRRSLSVNGLYGQFRFGEIELSAGGLPLQPTNVMEPGPAAYAAEQATTLRELVLDDGSNSELPPGFSRHPSRTRSRSAAAPRRHRQRPRRGARLRLQQIPAAPHSDAQFHH